MASLEGKKFLELYNRNDNKKKDHSTCMVRMDRIQRKAGKETERETKKNSGERKEMLAATSSKMYKVQC